MANSLKEAFAKIQGEEREKEYRLMAAQLRKFLAGALCTVCGEPLGADEEIVQNDDEETMHARCEPTTEQGDKL